MSNINFWWNEKTDIIKKGKGFIEYHNREVFTVCKNKTEGEWLTFGRVQFSVEKAKTERTWSFHLQQRRQISLSALWPALWPEVAGKSLATAHLRLPSIISATCFGIRSALRPAGNCSSIITLSLSFPPPPPPCEADVGILQLRNLGRETRGERLEISVLINGNGNRTPIIVVVEEKDLGWKADLRVLGGVVGKPRESILMQCL